MGDQGDLRYGQAFRQRLRRSGNRSEQIGYDSSGVANKWENYTYRGDRQLVSQTNYTRYSGEKCLKQINYFNETGMRDAVGNQANYRYVVYKRPNRRGQSH